MGDSKLPASRPASGEAIAVRVPARVGLLGNPSDGYRGACIAVAIENFAVVARFVRGGRRVSIRCNDRAPAEWENVTAAFAEDLRCIEDGAAQLALAAIRRVASSNHVIGESLEPHGDAPGLALELRTDVPLQCGFSGSSALALAAMRAVAGERGVSIPKPTLASLALAVETRDLDIAAGPMDRLIQAHGGALFMDFADAAPDGKLRRIATDTLPTLFLAWDPRGGRPSGALHGGLRERWLAGEPGVREAIGRLRAIAIEGEAALRDGDHATFRALVDRNFDERAALVALPERDLEMVAIARGLGAAAKLCGSGGGALVAPTPDTDLDDLEAAYRAAGFSWSEMRPEVTDSEEA